MQTQESAISKSPPLVFTALHWSASAPSHGRDFDLAPVNVCKAQDCISLYRYGTRFQEMRHSMHVSPYFHGIMTAKSASTRFSGAVLQVLPPGFAPAPDHWSDHVCRQR